MNDVYEKLPDEEQYEYGLRLISTKIENQPDDLDWQDIVELIGLDCHRDTLRKACSTSPYSGYNVMKYYEDRMSRMHESGRSSDVESKIDRLRVETKKYYDQRREYNKLMDELSREENLYSRLEAAARSLNEMVPLTRDLTFYADEMASESDAVLVLNDWHYGMKTDNIWERYDTDICRKRVAETVDAVRKRIALHQCRRLHIVILGDMAHGAIHTSARVASEELTCDQLMHVSELIAQAVNALSDMVQETIIHATYGNHMRTIQNKNDSIHADNMEKVIPWWMEQRFKDRSDICFQKSDYYEFICFNVCGCNICATHGDLDNVKGVGRLLSTLFRKQYGVDLDYVILADKHHQEEFEELGIESFVARSLSGTDEYANGKRLYSTPGQLLMIFNEDDGKDAVYQLKFKRESRIP